MIIEKKKAPEFKYGLLSWYALGLAIEIWNKYGYSGAKPSLEGNPRTIDWYIKNLEMNKTDSIEPGHIVQEPRYGLPDSEATKLIIKKDLTNDYGFTLRVGPYDTDTPEKKKSNIEAKVRIEAAWAAFGLPYERW